MSSLLTRLPAQQRQQVTVGLICATLAGILYAIKEPEPVAVETVAVLALARDLGPNEPIGEEDLVEGAVPPDVKGDYLLATDENRAGLLNRRSHLALATGTRLTTAMFLGGLGGYSQSTIPPGWTQIPLEPRTVPQGTVPGSKVDLLDKDGKVRVRFATVFSVAPFEVLFPSGQTPPIQPLLGGTVTLRNPNEPGEFEFVQERVEPPKKSQKKARSSKQQVN